MYKREKEKYTKYKLYGFMGFESSTIIRAELMMEKLEKVTTMEKKHGTLTN